MARGSAPSAGTTVCDGTGAGSASQSSSGIDTNAGPHGGVVAASRARATAPGTSAARAGSIAHFTYGCGSRIDWGEDRYGSVGSMARVC